MAGQGGVFSRLSVFLVTNKRIDMFVSLVICLNAVTIAMQTLPAAVVPYEWHTALHFWDEIFLYFFCVEVTSRIILMLAVKRKLAKTTKDIVLNGWNLFDVFTVVVGFIPGLNALRTFRLLRLLGRIPSFKELVSSMLVAFRHSLTIFWLSLFMVFIFGVTATLLFGAKNPEYFGHLGESMLTLYHLMFFDDLSDVMRSIYAHYPQGWIFFIIYPVVMGLIILSLLLGVILDTMAAAKASPNATRNDIDELRADMHRMMQMLEKHDFNKN